MVVCAEGAFGSQVGLTEDQLEYGTRTKDTRFLPDFSDEMEMDFNAPFQLLAGWQEAFQCAGTSDAALLRTWQGAHDFYDSCLTHICLV